MFKSPQGGLTESPWVISVLNFKDGISKQGGMMTLCSNSYQGT